MPASSFAHHCCLIAVAGAEEVFVTATCNSVLPLHEGSHNPNNGIADLYARVAQDFFRKHTDVATHSKDVRVVLRMRGVDWKCVECACV